MYSTTTPLSRARTAASPCASPAAGGDVTLEERLWRGGYPALHARHRRPDPTHSFSAYVATYLERDVRQLLNVGNLLTFQRFLAMCAARQRGLARLPRTGEGQHREAAGLLQQRGGGIAGNHDA